MGYRKKGSAASLLSSGTFALVLLMAGCFMQNPGQAATGIRIALGVASTQLLLLTKLSGNTQRWTPADVPYAAPDMCNLCKIVMQAVASH